MLQMFKRWFGKDDNFIKIQTQKSITIKTKDMVKPFTMSSDHKLFQQLSDAVEKRNMEAVLDVIALTEKVISYTEGKVAILNGVVHYNGKPIHNIVAKRILQFMAEGIPVHYLIKFLERVMQNPLESAREELFLFLENGNLPIMDDGRFQAYKWVDENLKDCRTHKFDNSVGAIVSMPREQCDTNRRALCSTGLHVCTQYYEKFGDRLVLVAVAPEDVVAVPEDYKNAKMRTWQYEVLEEINAEAYGHIQERALVQYRKPVPVAEDPLEKIIEKDIEILKDRVETKPDVAVDKDPPAPVEVKLSKSKKVKGTGMSEFNWDKFKRAVKNKKSIAEFGLSDCKAKELRQRAKDELNGQSSNS